MNDSNLMIRKFTIRYSDKIKKICEPLYRYFRINSFWHSNTNAAGKHFTIGSNPEFHDFYYSSKLYLHSPFFRHADLVKPGFYSYRSFKEKNFQNTIDTCSLKFSLEMCIGFVLKRDNHLVRFGYATDPSNARMFNDVFINNKSLLLKFNEYFLQETKDLTKGIEDFLVDLPSEMGESYYYPSKEMTSWTSAKIDQYGFLEELGLIKKEDILKLSRREMQCLQHLQQGLSASESGEKLGISRRTIEHYRDSIKNKLNCSSKSELREISELIKIANISKECELLRQD